VTIEPIQNNEREKILFNILLVEDNTTDALLVESYIEKLPNFGVQTAENLSHALECLDSRNFDVILLDLNLPDALGLESLIKLRRHVHRIPIVVLTGVDDEELGIMALQRGAQDYLIKGLDNNRLMKAIRYAIERMLVNDFETSITSQHYTGVSSITEYPQSPLNIQTNKVIVHEVLTVRELQVLKLLGKGYNNQEIATRLIISIPTVKTHIGNILRKLSVADRTKAVIEAQHCGLI
jgi:DNA-binding NarL/FixJ family response regulator